jgi:hypothetical protein
MSPEDKRPPSGGSDRIEWFTVRYRTLGLAGAAIVLLALVWWLVLVRRTPPPSPVVDVETGARFMSIEGRVEVKRSGTLEWIPATMAIGLRQNDLVRTGSGGTAEIRLADGTVFNLRTDGLMTIEESTQNPVSRQQRVALSIQSGEANFQTAARTVPGSTTFTTPTVRTTTDRETTGNIRVDGNTGATGLKIFQGSARAETKTGQRIDLKNNEGVAVDAAGAAGPKLTLPQVPQLTAPPNQTEVAYQDLARAVTLLVWSAVPDASAYRVLVDYSPNFARPLYDRQSVHATQLELRGLDAGTYYWKVAAVDDKSVEGSYSDLWHFTLAKAPPSAATPPPLVVETVELKGNVLHVRGRTEPGASLSCNGARLEVQPDGTFNEFLTFEGDAAGTVLIRASGVRGGVAEVRHQVQVVD